MKIKNLKLPKISKKEMKENINKTVIERDKLKYEVIRLAKNYNSDNTRIEQSFIEMIRILADFYYENGDKDLYNFLLKQIGEK